ncbi:hypothetical protein EDEG_00681 [Edhazardia aedis USNM 41457]|uniref:Anaphase-promoting complex subunit 1 n=1 Tax=Edhazardia aedis (strain USNM 41457) TaxID=1003232 RepID=J9DBW4_EDHAE|nr:hypothetical protein EDEG_00681 [Edhazardia aedis USNM 41457]|eukprot:EJW05216.1 hypothetical protein EDEG_00681 [Edhazardia aedis USNM 41457]
MTNIKFQSPLIKPFTIHALPLFSMHFTNDDIVYFSKIPLTKEKCLFLSIVHFCKGEYILSVEWFFKYHKLKGIEVEIKDTQVDFIKNIENFSLRKFINNFEGEIDNIYQHTSQKNKTDLVNETMKDASQHNKLDYNDLINKNQCSNKKNLMPKDHLSLYNSYGNKESTFKKSKNSYYDWYNLDAPNLSNSQFFHVVMTSITKNDFLDNSFFESNFYNFFTHTIFMKVVDFYILHPVVEIRNFIISYILNVELSVVEREFEVFKGNFDNSSTVFARKQEFNNGDFGFQSGVKVENESNYINEYHTKNYGSTFSKNDQSFSSSISKNRVENLNYDIQFNNHLIKYFKNIEINNEALQVIFKALPFLLRSEDPLLYYIITPESCFSLISRIAISEDRLDLFYYIIIQKCACFININYQNPEINDILEIATDESQIEKLKLLDQLMNEQIDSNREPQPTQNEKCYLKTNISQYSFGFLSKCSVDNLKELVNALDYFSFYSTIANLVFELFFFSQSKCCEICYYLRENQIMNHSLVPSICYRLSKIYETVESLKSQKVHINDTNVPTFPRNSIQMDVMRKIMQSPEYFSLIYRCESRSFINLAGFKNKYFTSHNNSQELDSGENKEKPYWYKKILIFFNDQESIKILVSRVFINIRTALRIILTNIKQKPYLDLLAKNNKTDFQFLSTMIKPITRSTSMHTGVIFSNAFMNLATSNDTFIRFNTDLVFQTKFWNKFNGMSCMGLVHLMNSNSFEVLKALLPNDNMSDGGICLGLALTQYDNSIVLDNVDPLDFNEKMKNIDSNDAVSYNEQENRNLESLKDISGNSKINHSLLYSLPEGVKDPINDAIKMFNIENTYYSIETKTIESINAMKLSDYLENFIYSSSNVDDMLFYGSLIGIGILKVDSCNVNYAKKLLLISDSSDVLKSFASSVALGLIYLGSGVEDVENNDLIKEQTDVQWLQNLRENAYGMPNITTTENNKLIINQGQATHLKRQLKKKNLKILRKKVILEKTTKIIVIRLKIILNFAKKMMFLQVIARNWTMISKKCLFLRNLKVKWTILKVWAIIQVSITLRKVHWMKVLLFPHFILLNPCLI